MGNKTKNGGCLLSISTFFGKFFGQVTDSSEKNEGSPLTSTFIPHRAFF